MRKVGTDREFLEALLQVEMSEREAQNCTEGIAIIGMSGRFPSAKSVEAFWQNLCDGVEAISFLTDDELRSAGIEPISFSDANYVKAAGVLPEADLFDAAFFAYSPREAELLDPQQRLFLECSWEALETAGYDPDNYKGAIGVFAGASMSTYLLHNLQTNRDFIETAGSFQTLIANDKDFLPTRVSYKLNLKGPSLSIQTACSTSLVAVHVACQSLLNRECEMALAGGVAIRFPQQQGYTYQEGMIFSPDGHCRAFDAAAKGTIITNGLGIVVLKRLQDALADGDQVYAVIRGSAVNNDGSVKVGYTAPGVDGQAEVVALAQAIAGIEPDTIGYVETHGTGTSLGDPIEIAALTQAFRSRTQRKGFCAIGSVKTNVGHLDAAAGVAGLMKTALSLKHRLLPPSLHFKNPNPQIDFANSPFFVNARLTEWNVDGGPRRAGVSSFGIGGTNAHVVLEEAPPIDHSGPSRPAQLLLLSAKSGPALDAATANLTAYLKRFPDASLADVAFTLQAGRKAFKHRRVLVCADRDDALKALASLDASCVSTSSVEQGKAPVIFMFPGQGSQYPQMGRDLYQEERTFRDQVDLCSQLLEPQLGIDLRDVLYPGEQNTESAEQQLTPTSIAQPALFVIEYALATLWMEWGIKPQAMIGHSVGEYVAACLAGVFSLEDALKLLATRGRLMQRLPQGLMLAVRLAAEEVRSLIDQKASIAAINGPALCVVSGEHGVVEEAEGLFTAKGAACSRLQTSHAFHSEMMDPILEEFSAAVREINLRPPRIPYVSNLTGTWIAPAEATDPHYWAQHLRQTVRFNDALHELLRDPTRIMLEVGPGRTLSTLTQQHPTRVAGQTVLSSLARSKEESSDITCMLNTLGRLWLAGVQVNWSGFYSHERRQRVALPTYPFERKRYWVEPGLALDRQVVSKEQHDKVVSAESAPPVLLSAVIDKVEPVDLNNLAAQPAPGQKLSRHNLILSSLKTILNELSGIDPVAMNPSATFTELGFDSLFLTQAIQALTSKFGVQIKFRQLFEDLQSLGALADHLEQQLPPEALSVSDRDQSRIDLSSLQVPSVNRWPQDDPEADNASLAGQEADASTEVLERVIRRQLDVMLDQLELLRKRASSPKLLNLVENLQTYASSQLEPASGSNSENQSVRQSKIADGSVPGPSSFSSARFGPYKPIEKEPAGQLTSRQKKHLEELIARYSQRTAKSKQLTQAHRSNFADPRAVAGFNSLWKEMVYPITAARSAGPRIWDIDGNEYVDLTMGFGVNLFGHSPAFVTTAIEEQLRLGVEIGPQSPLAGKVAQLVCELTGMERATFCNTGSEAVMAALRVARAVTQRQRVALFSGSYHGTFDEVLVRGAKTAQGLRSLPAAPGVPPKMVKDVMVLEYGNAESLEILKEHAKDLAAVLVEPVQSRRPDLQPREFLQQLRALTQKAGVALVFDEVITGFRAHLGGCQAAFGVRADLATYGKVIGGGLPIGVLAGSSTFMDAFDGGTWSYGDQSAPQTGVTFFAGTFIRHPLAMAAALAVLGQLKLEGPSLQKELNEKTSRMAEMLNALFDQQNAPLRIAHFSSLFYLDFPPEQKYASLLFYHLRENGVHIWEGRPGFLSTAHTSEDIDYVVHAFQQSVRRMQEGGFFPAPLPTVADERQDENLSPEMAIAPPPSKAESVSREDFGDAANAQAASVIPLTEGQKEIWLATQMGDSASCAYNLSCSIHLRGPLQVEVLRRALSEVVTRHDALRATVGPSGDHQTVSADLTIPIPLIDLSHPKNGHHGARIKALVARETRRPFDLAKGPLLRAQLICVEPQNHVLVLTAHHIICDGWSFGVLLSELSESYSTMSNGNGCQAAKPMQFSDYALWQKHQQLAGEVAAAEAYWLEQYSSSVPVLELPTDRPRPPLRTYSGAQERIVINRSLYRELKQLSASSSCTVFTLLLAAYALLLRRLTGQEDIVVGIPAAGQAMVGCKDLVGHCANLLPLRIRSEGDQGFSHFLSAVKQLVLDAYEHQNYTFGSLVRKLTLPRDPSRLPLVSATFNLDPAFSGIDFAGLEVEIDNNPKSAIYFEIKFNLIDNGSEYLLECDYNTDLFDAETIQRRMGSFQTLLRGILLDPEQPLSSLPLLTESERCQMLVEWNNTAADYALDRCLHELFEAQVERTPEAIAVSCEGNELSYRELNGRANQLARYLRGCRVGPDVVVGICAERSLEMLIAVLGVLKAGGAFVPLDPTYPKERLALMLDDAKPVVTLTQQRLIPQLPVDNLAKVLSLDTDREFWAQLSEQNPHIEVSLDNLAYVMFTSGSTGKPKGVMIPHRAISNHLLWRQSAFPLTDADRFLHKASFSFDISVWEMFAPLLAGARMIMARSGGQRENSYLIRLIAENQITVAHFCPSHLQLFLEEPGLERCRSLRRVFCGGEVLDVDLQARFFARLNAELINQYGPTETTVDVTFYRIVNQSKHGVVPIGRPISNTQIYLLDRHLQPVPMGVPGELHVGGVGLARGYLDDDQFTAEKFIPNPFSTEPGARLYKTGDVARHLPCGNIEFVRRRDRQVKIRGFRIEPGEIEIALRQHPAVQESVVSVGEDESDNKRLLAYVVTKPGETPTSTELRQFLNEKLPYHMAPSAVVLIDALPRMPNGKIDFVALSALDLTRPELEKPYNAPEDTLELQLAKIWERVLKVGAIGTTDNFFDLGGQSILAMRLFAEIHKEFGKKLPLATIFQMPTIEQMGRMLREEGWLGAWSSLVPIRPRGSRLPLFIIHGLGGNVLNYYDLAHALSPEQPVYGLQSRGLDGKQEPISQIGPMAAHYVEEVRDLQPEGPYFLCGSSFGGVVAFEMAQQLHAQGQDVALVALLDTGPPGYLQSLARTTLLRFQVKSYLERFQYHATNLFFRPGRLEYIRSKSARIKRRVKSKLWRARFRAHTSAGSSLPIELQRVSEANWLSIREYVPRTYPGHVDLFLASRKSVGEYGDVEGGWRNLALAGVQVHSVAGDHLSILEEPDVYDLAEKLGACLSAAQRGVPLSRRSLPKTPSVARPLI